MTTSTVGTDPQTARARRHRLIDNVAGTSTLLRLALRRDRVRLPLWIGGIALLVIASASSVDGLYPTAADLAAAAEVIHGNAAAIALQGPAIGLETLGGRTVYEIGAFGYVVVALMNIFTVGRHTRAEEETGRAELVRANVVGRYAHLTAALVAALLANVATGALVTIGLIGLELPAAGSLAFGAALGAVGFAFAGVCLVAAQVTAFTRPAYAFAAIVVAAAFVLRAVGDVGSGTTSWLSPIGWGQAVRPFAGERWWALLLPAAFAVALCCGAFFLVSHRDLGGALVVPRAGSPDASRALRRPLGVAWRLQRGNVVGWTIGLALGGVVFGSIAQDIEDFIGDNEALSDIIAQAGGGLVDSYFATTLLMLALIGSGFAVSASLRPHREETAGYAEPLLATGVSRARWMLSHLVIAVVGSVAVVAAGGVGAGVAYGVSIGDAGEIGRITVAALARLPAVWLLVGVAAVVYGGSARWARATWGALALCLVIGFFGELLSLPGWLRDVSPFEHTPAAPVESADIVPLVALTAIAAALTAAGVYAFGRRDVTTT